MKMSEKNNDKQIILYVPPKTEIKFLVPGHDYIKLIISGGALKFSF